MEFWLYCFSCCIVKYRKELPFHFRSTADMWPRMDAKAQEDASSKDETVLFNAIGEVSVLMSQLSIDVPYVKKFISKCATTCRLGNSLTSSLTAFATKIIETQKANSDSLLDLKKTKIDPPEKAAERLFKFTKRARVSHKDIIRSLIPPYPSTGEDPKKQPDDGTAVADDGNDDGGISHICANGYDMYSLKADIGEISCVEVHKRRVFIGTKTGNVAVLDLVAMKIPNNTQFSDDSTTCAPKLAYTVHLFDTGISFISAGKEHAAVCSADGVISVLKISTGAILKENLRSDAQVTAIATSNDKFVASGTEDGNICLWDVESSEPQPAVIKGHTGAVLAMAFGKHSVLVSGGEDKTVRVWDLKTNSERALFDNFNTGVKFICAVSSEKYIAGSEGEAMLLHIKKKSVLKEFSGIKPGIASYAFSKDESYILLALSESCVFVNGWDDSGDMSSSLKVSPPLTGVNACSLGKKGEITVVGSDDGAIHLWCNLAKSSLHTFRCQNAPITALRRISSRILLSVSEGSVVNVWRISEDVIDRWSKGCLVVPKVVAPEGSFRFRHNT